jgi:lipopolysaccharide biosynthesis glycosyltransferase
MKQMIYQVSVGKPSNLYQACIDSVNKYCKKYGIDHIIQTEPILKIVPDLSRTGRSKEAVERLGYLPIYEKENAFSYIDQYDQIAIVDSDIFIKDSAPNIFDDLSNNYAFGAVVERDLPCTEKYRIKITKYSKGAFTDLNDVDWKWNKSGAEFYNMGLIVFNCAQLKPYLRNQTPKQFLSRPEFKDFVDGIGYYKWSTDQIMLNWWVKKETIPVKNMDWRWNALYKGIDDKYLKDAYFIHFFLKDKLPEQGENIKELLGNIY